MKSLNLTSYAKLNLYLEVLGKRPDNYHSLFTIFERISLSDRIRLKVLPEGVIRIVSSCPGLPLGSKNLAYQAASILKQKFAVRQGVEIKIEKHIPLAAGLAGGSSNAAAVLAGLNKLWRLKLGFGELMAIARRLGSDVPFFLHNRSFAFAKQRGDKIDGLSLPVQLWHVVVVPPVKISSAIIYKEWDKLAESTQGQRLGLTKPQTVIKILKKAVLSKDISALGRLLFNSLEQASAALYPVINKIKKVLSELGLEATLMSGSGPAVFGLLSSRKEAYSTARKLKAKKGNWDVFVAKTV
ncbi:4-(cytidine 5'-diphospho)-2-C-methyl-D-erythritol kinase [Candidatus Omnitrophota bacterium]